MASRKGGRPAPCPPCYPTRPFSQSGQPGVVLRGVKLRPHRQGIAVGGVTGEDNGGKGFIAGFMNALKGLDSGCVYTRSIAREEGLYVLQPRSVTAYRCFWRVSLRLTKPINSKSRPAGSGTAAVLYNQPPVLLFV